MVVAGDIWARRTPAIAVDTRASSGIGPATDRVMERSAFERSLRRATRAAIEVARSVVINELSDRVRYWATIGFEEGRGPPIEGEQVRKERSLPDDVYHGPWTAEQVVDYYWVAGTVPIWISAVVRDVDDHTFLWLSGCVVFTAIEDRLFRFDGCPPFGIRAPSPPRDWVRGEKFDLRASQAYPLFHSRGGPMGRTS